MLLPLLAMPVRHPLANLLVQNGLSIAGGLAAMFLLPRYVLAHPGWPLVGLLSAGTFLAWAPADYRFEVLSTHQPYGVALALGLGGLILAEAPAESPRRGVQLALALGLLTLAHWVNVASALVLGPVIMVHWLTSRSGPRPRAGVASVLLGVAFAGGWVLRRLAHGGQTLLALRPPGEWLAGAWRLAENAWLDLEPHHWPLVAGAAAVAGLFFLAVPAVRRRSVASLPAAVGLGTAALAYALMMGALSWVADNRFPTRYVIPSLLLLQTALATVAAAPLGVALRARMGALVPAASGVLLLVVAAWSYGWPSLGGVRAAIDDRLGERTADVLDARCTHVAGSYWRVWPAVFHANLVLYERGESRVVWGVSERSQPLRRAWRGMPREAIRVAVPPNDANAAAYLDRDGLAPLVIVEKRPTVWVLRPASSGAVDVGTKSSGPLSGAP